MSALLKAILIAGFLAPVALAEGSADVSLGREVDQYLEQSSTDMWRKPNTMRSFFESGLQFESNDGNFKMKISGRLHWDNIWRSSDEFGDSVTADSTSFRRIRLATAGTIYKRFVYKVQLDFSGGTVAPKDVYGALTEIRLVGTFKFGHYYEPFGLQQLTSDNYIQVIERSTIIAAFAPGRNSGVSVGNAWLQKRLTVQVWYGRTTDNLGEATQDGGGVLTVRVTGLALWNEQKKMLLHIGTSFSVRDIDSFRARARPGVGDNDRLVDTGSFDAQGSMLYGIELAFRWRSVAIQGEYILADVESDSEGDPRFGGFYIEISWFITGESRQYKQGAAKWARTRPKRNFHDGEGGLGAIQVVLRFDRVDLNDQGINGGEMDTLIFGVNWHWNPNVRVMFNFIYADVTDGGPEGEGSMTAFSIRFQVDF